MTITAKIVHMTDNKERNDDLWRQVVTQLAEYWESSGADIYQREPNLAVSTLIEAWHSKTLVIVLAYDGEDPIGIGIGIQYRHLLYSSDQLVLEVLYSKSDEALKQILKAYGALVETNGIDRTYIQVAKRDPDLLNRLVSAGVTLQPDGDTYQKSVVI